MYLDYVNIKMGTDSVPRFSKGNTLPLTQVPFGMVSFAPQTERLPLQEEWFFSPNKPYLEGIRLTHQPSPWIADYGTVLFVPQNNIICDEAKLAWSGYRIEDSIMRPDYLKVNFLKQRCLFELTPTQRGCAINLEFENEGKNAFSILNVGGKNEFSFDKKNGILYCTNNHHSKDDAKNFKMYFVVKFLEGVADFATINEEKGSAHILLNGKKAKIRVAISYLSFEQALLNFEQDKLDSSFESIRDIAKENWEEKLSRIEIEADEKTKKVFYSCMYRAFLFPHKAYEIEKSGACVHYSPFLGKKCDGVKYTDTGFWDTSRTQFPLFSLIAKDEYAQMLEGFLNDYNECGFLPRWHSLGEVGCMPSTFVDATIADAVVKGIGTKDLHEKLLFAMIKHANVKSNERRYGREGVLEYLKYGYVPADLYRESVNLTLDFAYGDYCIAIVCEKLGKDDLAKEYYKRAENYKHLFDKETKFMRPKTTKGNFKENFNPFVWGGDYTEGSAYQTTFSVPHDLDGLCTLFGGKEKMLEKLDEVFNTKPIYEVDGYGAEIHEMTEMAQVDFGQCAISNQPSFSLPYLYAYLGKKEKSEQIIKEICEKLFTSDDYPGDEDNGSMSSWYILSSIGKYPLCPGKDEWIELTPLVKIKNK